MGIQINGQNDTISATDGSLNLGGTVTVNVTGDATGLSGTPNINVGVLTAASAVISGNLQVDGTTTTLDTLLTEVDKLEVGANNTTVGVAITQSGTGDILRLYDSSTQVVTVKDGGNVGINRADPDQKLNINGNLEVNAYDSISGSGGYYTAKGLIIGNAYDAGKTTTDDRNAIIWQERGLDLDIATNDTLRMKLTYDGKVGIGTDNPTSNLTIAEDGASTNAELAINYTGSGNRTSAIRFQRSGTNYGYIAGAAFMLTTGAQDDLAIAPVSGKNLLFGIGNSEKLRISSSGNIGIGTTNPDIYGYGGKLLTVSDSSTFTNLILASSDASNSGISFGGQTLRRAQIQGGSGSDSDLIFLTNSSNSGIFVTEKVRITSSGLVGIGTDNPDAKLHLYQSDSTNYSTITDQRSEAELRITNPLETSGTFSSINFYNGGGTGGDISLNAVKAGNYASHFTIKQRAGGGSTDWRERLRITSDGLVGIGTDNPEVKLELCDGGMYLKNQTNTQGVVFRQPRPELANVQQSNGRGMMDASVSVPASTTVSIARSHWGGIALVGFSGGAQGYRLVSFGYNNTPTVLYSADWQGSLSTTFSTSTYDLRVSHNSGTAKTFWVILIGV